MDPSEHLGRLLDSVAALAMPRSPRTRGFDLESVNQLQVTERFIPLSTLYFFLDFSFEGRLPGGGETLLELITEDEVPLLSTPYVLWAKAPWNRTSSSLQERLLDTPARFCADVPRKISIMRARLWEGMTPMSDSQWKARKLDETANWKSVFEFLLDIIHTFEWLGHPDVRVPMKNSFNHTAQVVETFGSAINARREEMDIQERVDMGALWLEYITSLFNTMVARTHAFFLTSVKSTISKARAEYDATVDEKGVLNSRAEAKRCGQVWSDLERALHRADTYIMVSLDGYTGFASSPSDSKVVGSLVIPPSRWKSRKDLEQERPWPIATRHADDTNALYVDRQKLYAMLDESDRNHDHVRSLQRGEPKSPWREPWISIIQSRTQWSLSHGGPQDQKWGFVGYMLTRKPCHQEWEMFLSRLYADFHKSGGGIEGFDMVKHNMDIQWINGKDSGLPHDDIEAAKRHFRAFSSSTDIRKRVWKMDFLVVDSECFHSYMNPEPKLGSIKCSGDYGGYLKLVDTAAYRQELIDATSPGYQNQMRVLGRLVFDDLYPQLAGLVQRPRDLWPLAMLHPKQVYAGFPVQGQMSEWENVWKARVAFWAAFCRWKQAL
ncbi:hypothetical protein P171DRAFT_389887 [Karstenula rhodostoma CBS 690.94]|uniref:Uncharacterized protein n=1 Tax=Karstenula rhodostoma CBS 690.94 TaxID=1392251 RepID=A0A9P4UBR2_9PLEO|nr:hypothetical protein P171DRAFT_389887 [Karstenula rhodostoma CBS 690.94]